MLKLKRISNKTVLISVMLINIFIFLSFLFEILIQSNFISDKMYLLALPSMFLSSNFFIVIIFILFEFFIILYCWYRHKKQTSLIDIACNSDFEVNLNESLFNESLDDITEINNEQSDSENSSANQYDQAYVINYSDFLLENEEIDDFKDHDVSKKDFDLSPTFLSHTDSMNSVEANSLEIIDFKDISFNKKRSNKSSLSDQEFALFQTIVNNNWLYERSIDRSRINIDQHSIDESNINLSVINKLTKLGMIYRKEISHPTGPFFVITSDPRIEKRIIFNTIRRILRKNRIKLITRKVNFANWEEFGIAKKTWSFDFEIAGVSIIGCIYDDNCFSLDETGFTLTLEKKNELKALIAASTLKMKEEGKPVIITTKKLHKEIIRKYIKQVGWGKLTIIIYSDSKFENKFENLLNMTLT